MEIIASKVLKLNSIKNPAAGFRLKPCEARAGHGCVTMMIGVAAIGLILFGLIRLGVWLWALAFR